MGLVLVLLLSQGLLLAVDEAVFHRRRGLGDWERLGHPLDSFGMALCLAFASFSDPTSAARWVFGGLALASCLSVTKDEAIHAKECGGPEHWLHACLFLLHSAVLMAAYFLWTSGGEKSILGWGALGASAYALLQLGLWSTLWRDRRPG